MNVSIDYRNKVIKCNVIGIYPATVNGITVYSAYCTTDMDKDMWVHSYSETLTEVFKAEICGDSYSLDHACNHVDIQLSSGYTPCIKYNWQRSAVRTRY